MRALLSVGDAGASTGVFDDRGTVGRERGDACEERWTAGEDMEACRIEGVRKLVNPAIRTFSTTTLLDASSSFVPSSGGPEVVFDAAGGTGDGVEESLRLRRNVTLDSSSLNIDFSFSFSFSFSFVGTSNDTLSFPSDRIIRAVTVASLSSLVSVGVSFRDRVAVRKVSRSLPNAFDGEVSAGMLWLVFDVEFDGCDERVDVGEGVEGA